MSVRFEYDFDSALAAMVYIAIKRPRNPDKYKICKLIVLADKTHLVRFARPITGGRLCALEWGPVPSETLDVLNGLVNDNVSDDRVRQLAEFVEVDRRYKYPHIVPKAGVELPEQLSKTDLQALDEVIELYGDKSFEELKLITHEMAAYKAAWGDGSKRSADMKYEDLFAEDSDALQGAYEEMIENYELSEAFKPEPAF